MILTVISSVALMLFCTGSVSEITHFPQPNEAGLTHGKTHLYPAFNPYIQHFRAYGDRQEPAKDLELHKILNRLIQFDLEEQKDMVESIRLTMLEEPHQQFSSLEKLAKQIQKKKLKTSNKIGPKHYKSSEFAPALRLRTRIIKPSSSRWKAHAKKYPNPFDPKPIKKTWQWSYGLHCLQGPAKETSPSEMIRRIWNGELPEPDRIAAEVAAILDTDPTQQAVADYFEHSYRDRDGRVYSGFTMEQMWASGVTFGISDVETIAFLRLILEDDSIKSPINKRLHSGLYSLIKDMYLEYREYKQLREALAARFANPNGKVPLVLKSATERFDIAWAMCDYEIEQMQRFLKLNPTRKEFFAAISEFEEGESITPEELQERLAEHKAFPVAITRAGKEALRLEGLMGLRGR